MVYSDREKLNGRPDFGLFYFFTFFGRIFAAANAAATTRLSVGNEEVFRNFTPENDFEISEIKNINQIQINLKLSGSQSI